MPEKPTAVLDRLWDDVPVRPAPVADLIAGARATRRRRRTVVSAAAVAAAAVLGAGTLGAQYLGGGGDDTRGVVADGPADPAPDTRLVGIGAVAVAAPEAWSSNDASCNSPVRDTTFFPYLQDCAGPSRAVSSVAITSGPFSEVGIRPATLDPDGQVGGYDVVASEAVCDASGPDGLCHQAFGVPELDAYFAVTIPTDDGGTDQIAAIRNSLTVLGDDQVAVPYVPMTLVEADRNDAVDRVRAALEAAGLRVTVNRLGCPDTGSCISGVVGTTPDAGRVVPAGSVVTIDVL